MDTTDPPQSPLDSTDIVILVMGIVGSGRSTFINSLLPNGSRKRMAVGESLRACTTTTDYAILDSNILSRNMGYRKDYRLVLVDTPGFDADHKSDSQGVLSEIVEWSKRFLPDGQKCRGGVIFMHDISCDIFQGAADLTALGNAFNSPPAPPRLAIATSKWRNLRNTVEADRRHNLLQDRFKQASFHKFKDERNDAWRVVKEFLPQIERGAMLDFTRVFGDMRTKKANVEGLYKREKESFLKDLGRSILRFFGFGRKRK
ncbi:hypothetical protein NMY22_g10651 [Coprinellus aureogranulatus]|nr:hypothetical protein NMY22_g10651 [Coprinellus aureogranulatus]